MSTTKPIKDKIDLEAIKNVYLGKKESISQSHLSYGKENRETHCNILN